MVAGIPGALSNQPPADASIPQDVAQMKMGQHRSGSVHKEATRSFEIDTTIVMNAVKLVSSIAKLSQSQ